LVLAAWNERLKLPAQENDSVTDETLSSWISAYEIAWHLKQVTGTTADTANEPYVHLYAKLLAAQTKRSSVPIATVDGHSQGRVQTLWIDIVEDQQGLILFHPQFEWTRKDFAPDFLGSIEIAWRLADEDVHSGNSAFWHVTESDGSPIISEQQSGTSASAAAFRVFWHLRHGLRADEDVFVLASCAAGDGRIQDVCELDAKICAIHQHRNSLKQEAPATIVVATMTTNRTPQDDTAVARARTWAEVVLVGTVDELVTVRSITVQVAKDYLAHLAEHWDKTPWHRNGEQVRFSDVHITPFVWKPKPGHTLLAAAASTDGRSEVRDWRPVDYDPSAADREAGPRLERTRTQERVPWHETFRNNEAITVIAGGPGSGKTSILQWTARTMALQGLDALEKRTTNPDEIDWPVQTDLDTWTSLSGQPAESLERIVIESLALVETLSANRLKALRQFMRRRLIQSKANTFFVFDALDQVLESRVLLLRERLQAIASHSRPEWLNEPGSKSKPCSEKLAREIFSRGTKILISTRESGLRTHQQAMSFASISTLQAAALSAEEARELATKWLGADEAARMEAHLRANPSLGVVVDSPLLLTLACLVQSEQPQRALPETPAALYQEMMRLLAKGAWRTGNARSVSLPDANELLDSLPPIAWQLFSRDSGTNRFDRCTLLDTITRATGRSQVEAAKLLAQLVDLGLLESSGRQDGDEHFHFRHATFREFLAASHVASRINRDGWNPAEVDAWHPASGWGKVKAEHLLDTQAFEPAWKPFIVFIAGLMKEPLPLIEVLANQRKDDLYRHRLGLLCKCCWGIASDKEVPMLVLLQSVVKQMERIGSRAVRRRPERWKRWLENIGCLLALPRTSRLAIKVLIDLAGGRHEMKMHGDHEVCELLARQASTTNYQPALDGLLALCTGELESYARADVAKTLVECAETNHANEYVHKLSALLETLTSMPSRQVAIAGGLLVSRDADIVDQAIRFLKGKAQDWSAEEWVRSSAIHTLINLLGREQELKTSAFLVEALFNPVSFQYRHGYGNTFASDIVVATERRPSDFGMALTLLILRTCAKDMRLRRYCGEALAVASDPWIRRIGLDVLRELMCHIQKDGCNDADHLVGIDAAKSLAKLGGDEDKTQATEFLWFLTDLPIKDGYNQYFAIEALLEMGIPYGQRMHEVFVRCANCETAEPRRIAYMGAMARAHGDHEFVRLITPRLEWLVEVAKPNHTSKEPGPFDRDIAARGLFGTEHWKSIEESAFSRLYESVHEDSHADWFAVDTVAFGAKSSAIIALIPELIRSGKMDFRPWHKLMRELDKRGWRLRLRGRQIEILRKGQEEPRSDVEFGY